MWETTLEICTPKNRTHWWHLHISGDIWYSQTESGGHTQFKQINFKQWNRRNHQNPMNQKKLRIRVILSWVLQDLQRRSHFNTPQSIPENRKGGNASNLIQWSSITLILKPDKDTSKKEIFRLISLMNIDAKILNNILANLIQKHIKKLMLRDQVGYTPGMQVWFNNCNNVMCAIHQFNRLKVKSHKIISIKVE